MVRRGGQHGWLLPPNKPQKTLERNAARHGVRRFSGKRTMGAKGFTQQGVPDHAEV
ncbi:hypothetical protein COCCADRAFT_109407 [Bipolaris zeicola 26-R-13]|uniref:Uncharacterized protein n=1 Tax=Cochliobolus carbonum (strain 26-R-13) TaxID=930089 RepID=W6XM91_COCC2|nr:uncharacterized protein COCCADRAFT_109407 [Bipolaris zeicola 26-R-13]EUC28352.1 hypothetical protein COCCADRAFT_109407 [Bipolaris zeicola 26-R-13]